MSPTVTRRAALLSTLALSALALPVRRARAAGTAPRSASRRAPTRIR